MASRAWTLRTLVEAAGVEARLSGDAEVTGLSYDARSTGPGDLFFCIHGARTDGHDLAGQAVEAGAPALVVERELPLPVPQARVPRVREAIGPLSATFYGHPSADLLVAGVTGTNGKTTVAHLIESIALEAGLSCGVIGTLGARLGDEVVKMPVGTPEAVDLQGVLARMRDGGARVVALETTSIALDMGRVDGTRYACAAFTNLTEDHIGEYLRGGGDPVRHHVSMEAYFEAKAKLFDPAYTRRGVINTGDAYGRRLYERVGSRLEVLTYGSEDADLFCERAELGPTGTRASLRTPEGTHEIETELVGGYNIDNCLCALGVALQLGIGVRDAVRGLRGLETVPGRLERVEEGQPFLVLVDYAHTPDALRHALGAARELATGRVIVVFGCGGDRDRAKRPQMGEAAGRLADLTLLTSDNPRSEDPRRIIEEIEDGARQAGDRYSVEPDRRSAIAIAFAEAGPGDVVLIAGKGHESGQTFADSTVPFDDREVARELLREASCPS